MAFFGQLCYYVIGLFAVTVLSFVLAMSRALIVGYFYQFIF
jgi:hypothetical protein